MGNDVRLTLIATGFATGEALAGSKLDKEMAKLLKGKTDEELEVPSFMRYRRPLAGQRPRPLGNR